MADRLSAEAGEPVRRRLLFEAGKSQGVLCCGGTWGKCCLWQLRKQSVSELVALGKNISMYNVEGQLNVFS